MKTQAVFILVIFLLAGLIAQAAEGTSGAEEAARQLRIYSETLVQGSSEEVRVDAAIGLLLRNDEDSLQVLLSALKASDNPAAQTAVCRALIKSRGLGTSAAPAEQFVDPLMQMLSGEEKAQAQLAAEALLIYPYNEVSSQIQILVHDSGQVLDVRFNCVYALQLRPETEALKELIRLLDETDPELVRSVENALQEAFGIPVGTKRQVWIGILEQLQQKSPEDIRRERLLRQEMKLREVQLERDRWQKLYLSALDREFESMDPALQGEFLLDKLGSDLASIRRWGMLNALRLSTDVDPALRDRLLKLVSDEDREVRLQAAKVLTTMSALNPAEKLLEQYNKETDPIVALAMFEALGEACYFAFSPGSNITLKDEIRAKTLDISVKYLQSETKEQAQTGAEVIRKMLELNGLDQEKAEEYLNLIFSRYEQASKLSSQLRSELLMKMARLSAQGPHKASAGKLYRQAFINGLEAVEDATVRLASVTGLSGIDQIEALRIIREKNSVQDYSPAVREVIFEIASEVGTADDLEWLSKLLGMNGMADSVWPAIRSVCQRQDASFNLQRAEILLGQGGRTEWIRQLLELAEQKAETEKKQELLVTVWTKLIKLSVSGSTFEQAIAVYHRIPEGADSKNEICQTADLELIQAGLGTGAWAIVNDVAYNYLKEKDISNPRWIVSLDEFFDSKEIAIESKKNLIGEFQRDAALENRPKWKAKLGMWSKLVENYNEDGDPEGNVSERAETEKVDKK